jgi:hypothetical protein
MTTPTDPTVQWTEQDISAKLDYSQTYPDLLTASDTIASSVWAPVAGLTFSDESTSGSTVTVWIEATVAGLYRVTNSVVTSAGRKDTRTFLLYVTAKTPLVKSSLFYRDEFVAKFRSESLPSAARFLSAPVSDDYLWAKLKAAEADAQRELHVYLVPTVLFPNDPTQAEIDALAGAPWAVDPGYDYEQDIIQPGGWSFIALRQRPVITLESIKFSYPSMGTVFSVPSQWIKVDKKYGHVRFIPTSNAFTTPMGGMMIGAMGMQGAPQFIEIRYTAGLKDAVNDYPDLIDLVQRMVLLRLMSDAVVSASESISADGLSQSKSAPDLDKMQAGIDRQMETLRQRIHGVPLMVL